MRTILRAGAAALMATVALGMSTAPALAQHSHGGGSFHSSGGFRGHGGGFRGDRGFRGERGFRGFRGGFGPAWWGYPYGYYAYGYPCTYYNYDPYYCD